MENQAQAPTEPVSIADADAQAEAEAAIAEAEQARLEREQVKEAAEREKQKIEDAKAESQVALPNHKRKLITTKGIEDYNFDPAFNVRDISMYDVRVREKVSALLEDKLIRTPLVVCEMRGAAEGAKPVGACGFLRAHALMYIKEHHPEIYREFYKAIPVFVYENCTERDRELLMLDHGLETGLTEHEVVLTVRRLDRTGQYTEKAMARVLHKSLLAIVDIKTRTEFKSRELELREHGVYITDKKKRIEDWGTLCGDFWRGRIQRYKRLNDADKINPRVLEEFKKACEGVKNAIVFTSKQCEDMPKWTKEQLDDFIDGLIAVKTGVAPKEKSKVWSNSTLVRVEKANRSEFLGVQLKAALGNEVAQSKVIEVEDKLLLIEKAIAYNPTLFWQHVNEINAAGPVGEIKPLFNIPTTPEAPVAPEPDPVEEN